MSVEGSEYVVDEANVELLANWLDACLWSREDATLLFLDIDPDSVKDERFSTFSGHGEVKYYYYDDDDPYSIMEYGLDEDDKPSYLDGDQWTLWCKTKRSCKKIAKSINLYDSAEPHEWIELAHKREIHIPWLDWAIAKGLYGQKTEPDAVAAPVADESVSEQIPWDLLAIPEKLIDAFGVFTGMNKAWFNNAKDSKLKAALHTAGKGGRGGRAPLYYVFPIMLWLVDPKRRKNKNKRMDEATGWRVLKNKFPDVYAVYKDQEPDAIDRG